MPFGADLSSLSKIAIQAPSEERSSRAGRRIRRVPSRRPGARIGGAVWSWEECWFDRCWMGPIDCGLSWLPEGAAVSASSSLRRSRTSGSSSRVGWGLGSWVELVSAGSVSTGSVDSGIGVGLG